MKPKVLQPEEITVHANQVYDPLVRAISDHDRDRTIRELFLFFKVYQNGVGDKIPPLIVASWSLVPRRESCPAQKNIKFYERTKPLPSTLQESIERMDREPRALEEIYGAPYDLQFGGIQQAVAATLAHSPIYALEIQSPADVAQARTMAGRGELLYVTHNWRYRDSYHEMVDSMSYKIPSEGLTTLRISVDALVGDENFFFGYSFTLYKHLLRFMREHYLNSQKK